MYLNLYRFLYPFAKLYWFLFRPKTFGAKVLIKCGEEILMIRHTYGKQNWTLPGGGMKRGEKPDEAAKREVKEEMEIDLAEVILLGQFFLNQEYKKDTVYGFVAEVPQKDFKIDGVEILEARWFNLDNLPHTNSFIAKEVLRLWQEKK